MFSNKIGFLENVFQQTNCFIFYDVSKHNLEVMGHIAGKTFITASRIKEDSIRPIYGRGVQIKPSRLDLYPEIIVLAQKLEDDEMILKHALDWVKVDEEKAQGQINSTISRVVEQVMIRKRLFRMLLKFKKVIETHHRGDFWRRVDGKVKWVSHPEKTNVDLS